MALNANEENEKMTDKIIELLNSTMNDKGSLSTAKNILSDLCCDVKDNFRLSQLCFVWSVDTGEKAYKFRNTVSEELNSKYNTNYDIYV